MVTAILNIYRRPGTLQKQITALRGQTIPPKYIWIWQNQAPEEVKVKIPDDCVLIQSNQNFYYHGRFTLPLLAQGKTPYTMILDDDIIPGKCWIENCIKSMEERPGIYVGVGRVVPGKIKAPIKVEVSEGEAPEQSNRQWYGWRAPNDKITEVDYGGHCWFFKTDWIRYFWFEKPAHLQNAEDMQFSFALQKHGGIKTYVPPHPMGNTDLWSNLVDWEYGKNEVASQINPPSGLKRKAWFKQRRRIRRKCIKSGWLLVNRRKGVES
jgi:GT2 family glycosyltransferase